MDEKIINALVNSFPWVKVLIAAILTTMIMTAISTTFYYKGSNRHRGVLFHIWEILASGFATLAVTEAVNLTTFASVQNFLFNSAAIFTNSILLYNFVGEPVLEARLGPIIRKYVNKIIDKVVKMLGITDEAVANIRPLSPEDNKTTKSNKSVKKTTGSVKKIKKKP